jgi:hypothetical protein
LQAFSQSLFFIGGGRHGEDSLCAKQMPRLIDKAPKIGIDIF